jgi:transposase
VLAVVEAGETPDAAARRFAVGRSTAYRWMAAARDEGRREAKRQGGGPAPRIAGETETALLRLVDGTNHLTLVEIAARLAESAGVRVHPTTVHRALRRAGWT